MTAAPQYLNNYNQESQGKLAANQQRLKDLPLNFKSPFLYEPCHNLPLLDLHFNNNTHTFQLLAVIIQDINKAIDNQSIIQFH